MKIICIGRNYSEHAREMNADVPVEPVFFMKPDTALLRDGEDFYFPAFSTDVHHEVEVVVRISRSGKFIDEKFAHKYYEEVTVGVDFTARDVQAECKKKGLPWEKAKAFDGSAPVGKMIRKSELKDINQCHFHLTLNGETVQNGNMNDMIFSINQIIAYVSRFITLKTGDLIFTGTPEGVGPVKTGDKLEAFLEDRSLLKFEVK